MLYLPDPGTWPVVTRDTLNDSATTAREQMLSVAAANAPLRVIYGTVTLGPQIACIVTKNRNWVILAVWGHGEVDAVTNLLIDDKALPAGVTATHYTGTAGQTVNAALVAAFAAQSPSVAYTDALPGICYSVVTVPPSSSGGFPRLTATIRGRKVYDPRSTLTAWSSNPALCLADFVTHPSYGMARTVDYASVASVANDCDVLAGGIEPLRTLDLCLDTVQSVENWLDTLRTYAACWVTQSGVGLRLISDKAGDLVSGDPYIAEDYFATPYMAEPYGRHAHLRSNIQSISSLKKRGVQSMPTVMTVTYRDVSTTPPRDGTATVLAPGVLAGTTPRRESAVSLPGITRYSQAWREATERLNKLTLNDLSCTLSVFDEGLHAEIGDIITVTHPIGLTDKPMRVMGISGDYGRYTLDLLEYDPAVYDSSVVDAPTYVDTDQPNPAAPPVVTAVTMTEEVFQQQNGTWSSRWRVTWTGDADYPYLAYYRAELWTGATLIHTAAVSDGTQWPTPAVQEGISYTAKISAVSSIGATSDYATQSGTAAGKNLLPGDVPGMSAFEAGGRVYITWLPATDIDVWRYEVRWGSTGGTWATAALLDRVDALRLQVDQLAVGTWALYVKCVDSVGNYSTNAATVNVTVTSDASAFLINTYDQTAPTLTGMQEYSLHPTDANRYFVTEDNAMFGTKYAANLDTFTDALATTHASQTSTWLGESEDFGLDLGGNITGVATVADVSGSHISYIGTALAAAPGTFTYFAGLSQKKNLRFCRLKHESLTTSTLLITIPTQSIRLDAIPREEVGSDTSSASGPVTITLDNEYVFVKKLTITPQGSTARSVSFDNVVLGVPSTFDVYIFNDVGTKIASPFQWQFQGV